MTPCIADETIAAWTSAALPLAERDHAIEHVASCDRCRTLVAHLFAEPAGLWQPMQIGRYVIRGPLGAGGMGVVLRGHDPVLGREVAIKMIKATLVEPAHRDRMLREAQAMAKISHPNVVTVHELGEAGDEMFVAMELVTGTMLHHWLATPDLPRTRQERIAVALGIGRGIAAVHAAEVLHRDIKPDNILVRDDGTPVLVDFGLARATAASALGIGSDFAGTPHYVPPEVRAGIVATAASDQYQWWTIVHELLVDLPRVAHASSRGRDPDPARRYSSMQDAVAALERAVEAPRRGRLIALGVALLVVTALGVGYFLRPSSAGAACDVVQPAGWSAARRMHVEVAARAAGLDPTRVLAAIDARVKAIGDLRVRACRESGAGGNERAEWTRRLVCLDETWAKAIRAIAEIERSHPAESREGVDALTEVLPADRCARGSLAAIPEPLPPAQSQRYRALAQQIQTLETDTSVRPSERTARLRALADEIAALHHAPLDARWHWGIAHALSDARDADGAAAEYDLAAQAGLAAGDDDLYVRALISELHVTSLAASPDRALQLESQAIAGARRLGNAQIDAQLLLARANRHMEGGDNAKARSLFEEADVLYSKISLAASPMHVSVLQNLGALCLELGDFAAADTYLTRAVALARERYTERGAQYWEARAARATSLLFQKQLDRAEPELRAAAEGISKTSPDSGQLGMMRAYLCLVALAQNKVSLARAECAASAGAMGAALGADSPGLVWPLTLSGQVELRAGAVAEALTFLRRATTLARAGHVRPIEAATADTYLAIALLTAHQTAEARALAVKTAPALRGPELSEARGDFLRSFPDLTAAASP